MIIGLTGGIGSGKSTVAAIFRTLGVPVYEADAASKEIIDTDKQLQQKLQKLLGDEVVKQGRIDRPYMARKIFNNDELLQQANALIHPAVGEHFKEWYGQQKAPYIIREAAILYESGTHKDCAKVVVVTAPEQMRIDRVVKRSKTTEEEVRQRMAKQWPEEEKVKRADYVVNNDHSDSVVKQVLKIHEDIIRQTDQGS